jgi:pyruvate/2-oxoglutarate dehydrogenase complex dihydrolipoamide acyltransferase (E2) component
MSGRFEIEPKNRFANAVRSIVEFEIRPGNTVTFLSEIDLTEIEQLRQSLGDRRPSYTAFVAKAVALALREFPYANRRISRRAWLPFAGPRLQKFNHCDIAVACERNEPGTEVATFADVLRDADQLSLIEISQWLHALNTCDLQSNRQWRTFQSIITRLPHWLSTLLIRIPYFFPSLWDKYRGASVLISSPAKYGVDVVAATWSWPLGISFGLVKERPVVRAGQVVACPTFMLTLNFDRRVMAGAQAARFFHRLTELLEHAATELEPQLAKEAGTRTQEAERESPFLTPR